MMSILFSAILLGFLGLILFPLSIASRRREKISESEALAAWGRVVDKQVRVRKTLEQLSEQMTETRRNEEKLKAALDALVIRIDEQMARGPDAIEQHDMDRQAARLMAHLADVMEQQVRDGKHAYNEAANDIAAASSDSAHALAVYEGLTSSTAQRSQTEDLASA